MLGFLNNASFLLMLSIEIRNFLESRKFSDNDYATYVVQFLYSRLFTAFFFKEHWPEIDIMPGLLCYSLIYQTYQVSIKFSDKKKPAILGQQFYIQEVTILFFQIQILELVTNSSIYRVHLSRCLYIFYPIFFRRFISNAELLTFHDSFFAKHY